MSKISYSWHDGLALGYFEMDETHHEFVLRVNALLVAPDEELGAVLQDLKTHLNAHFQQEDGWMIKSDFPAKECHINEHKAVLETVAKIEVLLEQGDVAVCRKLADELMDWFPGHANYLDSALAHWLCKRMHGGAPLVLRRNMTFADSLNI